MSNSYLELAECIIRGARRPLSPREILAQAYIERIVPAHLHGQTQEKTLQARLSEDILRLRERSLFFRTNRARFFLREFLDDPKISNSFKTEYFARARRKDLKNERILAFYNSDNNIENRSWNRKELDLIFERQKYCYITWTELDHNCHLLPIYSFVILHNGREILTHSIGAFKEASHPSQGLLSLGFGSVVRAQDSDLLYDAYHGIIGSAINELVYGLGLSRELTKEARYEGKVRLHCGLVDFDPQIGLHIRAVMTYRCPDDFLISKASLSLNRLRWMSPADVIAMIGFDDVSQKLARSGELSRVTGLA